jgi:putative transposase
MVRFCRVRAVCLAMQTREQRTPMIRLTLTMALWRRKKVDNLIVHSDQGSTYASTAYQKQ